MIRVLWIDVDARFLNRTRNLLPFCLASECDVKFYGPGYTSGDTLSAGLTSFLGENGPFDVLVTSPHIAFASLAKLSSIDQVYQRNYAFKFNISHLQSIVQIAQDLVECKLPRVGFFLETDYYNWTSHEVDAIETCLDYVVGLAPPFWRDLNAMPRLHREIFANNVTDVWWNWSRANRDRVASILPMIDASEVHYSALANRPHKWSVLGVGYAARSEAAKALTDAGLSPLGSSRWRVAFGALKRLGVIRRETDFSLSHLNFDFQQRLAQSRASFTCGSGLGMPIRKFFEIPAAGAVLVCQPFAGFNEAGFEDRVNAIVSEPEDILEVHKWLEANPEEAQEIADAGRSLVVKRHSVMARARQFAQILSRISKRQPLNYYWQDGRLLSHET